MAIERVYAKNSGHPWTGEEGWDSMSVRAENARELTQFIERMAQKFWKVWSRETAGKLVALLYKPTGATEDWDELAT